ncbi:MAG: DegV family protein [Anaerolineae bacterium]
MRIITDSCADLSPEVLAKYQITVVPLSVVIGANVYRDVVELSQQRLFALVAETGQMPKTAAPTVAEYLQAFAGDEPSVYISLSSALSASYHNAHLTAEMLPAGQVEIIDSRNVSTGIGHLAVRAAELRVAGWQRNDIVHEIEQCIPRVWTSFLLDTLEYLYKGGRCNALQNILGSVLRIHPVIAIRPDGTLSIHDKPRGARQRGLDSLLKEFTHNLPKIDRHRIFITHTACPEDAAYLALEVKRLANPIELFITEASSVIASHCGPKTIGILYVFTQ